MNLRTIITYAYFIIAIAYATNRILLLFKEDVKEYYLLFGKTTDSVAVYLLFTTIITLIILFLGYKRLQQSKRN